MRRGLMKVQNATNSKNIYTHLKFVICYYNNVTILCLIIGSTIADRANLYSKKISAVCCSQCHKPAALEPTMAIDEEDDSLIITESQQEERLASGSVSDRREPIYDNQFPL